MKWSEEDLHPLPQPMGMHMLALLPGAAHARSASQMWRGISCVGLSVMKVRLTLSLNTVTVVSETSCRLFRGYPDKAVHNLQW